MVNVVRSANTASKDEGCIHRWAIIVKRDTNEIILAASMTCLRSTGRCRKLVQSLNFSLVPASPPSRVQGSWLRERAICECRHPGGLWKTSETEFSPVH
jgi:hypothetical protein